MTLFLFGISMGEIVLIFLVVLMLFGSKKIPDLARSFGKGMNEFRKAAEDIKREFEESTDEIREEISALEENIRQNGHEIRNAAEDVTREDYGTHQLPADDVYGLDKPEVSSEELADESASPQISDESTATDESTPDSDKESK
jgi:TatA/E family protein of Tat protein translocase